MRKFLGCLLVISTLVCSAEAAAQSVPCERPDSAAGKGAVIGRVIDSSTQVPLGFAGLRLRILGFADPLEGESDTSGYFWFCSVPAGPFTLTGQLGQLGAIIGPLDLVPGQTRNFSLELGEATRGGDTGTLTGTAVDWETGDPLEGVTVLLPELGHTAVSNVNGKFTFPSLPPGETHLRANRLGYGEIIGTVEVDRGKAVHTRVRLSAEPVEMEPIIVTAVRRRIQLPGLDDFERRFHSGVGRFIIEEEIRRRSPRNLTSMLWEAGVHVVGDGQGIKMRRTGCAPQVYLDGVNLTHSSSGGAPQSTGIMATPVSSPWGEFVEGSVGDAAAAVNLVHPSSVLAVEIFRGPSEIPGEYLGFGARCGVILIWTRRGNISGG